MKPKKIILIVIDSLRRDHLGCYGYKRATTPNIDALAKSGILFKHAFSVCPNTVPSLASILTSSYPGNHSIGFDPEGKLDGQADRTLASILKNNKIINHKVIFNIMPSLSESNRIAHEVYKAHIEEINKRKGDIVVIDIASKKVLDVINKDEALTFMQRTADVLHRHIYLLNISPDKPLVWAR